MKLETQKTIIQKSQKEFFEFLTNLSNFEQLMPENINKFEVDGDSFLFSLKGMPEIRLAITEKYEFNKIVLGSTSSKLNFSLTADIHEISDAKCEAQLLFEGEFNAMMAMMVKSPLQKFINTLSENAAKL
jgi:carbon monoxide dehydrogenase subunit G